MTSARITNNIFGKREYKEGYVRTVYSWREVRSSIRRFVTGSEGHGMELNTKLSITHSFFELQTPDFEWKFVWRAQQNYKCTIV